MIKHLQSIFSIIDKLYQKAISGLKKNFRKLAACTLNSNQ